MTSRSRSHSSSWVAQATVDSPLGPLLLVASSAGLAGIWFDGQRHHPGELSLPIIPDHACLNRTELALADYWESARGTRFDVPLDLQGSAFQVAVWEALLTIPAGQTRTYGEIAGQIGRPDAVRAVGAAIGRNPISIIVPCHRVLSHDGRLTGYAGGLARKESLLFREAASWRQDHLI